MQWYLKVLKNYANFSGRARRMEYWMFTLFNTIIIGVLAVLMGFSGTDSNGNPSAMFMVFLGIIIIYALAVLVPNIAVTVRRLHDSDRSGAWFFIQFVPYVGGLVLIVLMCLNGTPGSNRFGDDPLAGLGSDSKDLQ